jgi:hypothetical protein
VTLSSRGVSSRSVCLNTGRRHCWSVSSFTTVVDGRAGILVRRNDRSGENASAGLPSAAPPLRTSFRCRWTDTRLTLPSSQPGGVLSARDWLSPWRVERDAGGLCARKRSGFDGRESPSGSAARPRVPLDDPVLALVVVASGSTGNQPGTAAFARDCRITSPFPRMTPKALKRRASDNLIRFGRLRRMQ